MDAENDIPMLSRNGVVAPLGTLCGELKTKVDSDTAEAFARMARQHGTDVSGALRDYAYWLVHGKTYRDLIIESLKGTQLPMPSEGPNGGLT